MVLFLALVVLALKTTGYLCKPLEAALITKPEGVSFMLDLVARLF